MIATTGTITATRKWTHPASQKQRARAAFAHGLFGQCRRRCQLRCAKPARALQSGRMDLAHTASTPQLWPWAVPMPLCDCGVLRLAQFAIEKKSGVIFSQSKGPIKQPEWPGGVFRPRGHKSILSSLSPVQMASTPNAELSQKAYDLYVSGEYEAHFQIPPHVPDSFAEEYEDHLKTLRPLSTKINNYRDALVSLTNIADESCQTLGVIEGKMFAVFPNRNAQRRAPSRASAKSSKPGQRLDVDCARIRLMSTAPTVAMLSTAPWTNSSPTLPSCSNVVSKLFGN